MELQSATVGKIAAALAQAQGEFPSPKKTATNPHLKKKYADLGDIRDAVQPVLTKHGLALVQQGHDDSVVTTLVHGESGEWFRSVIPVFEGNLKGAQGYGSGMTYARRYGITGITGVVADDDDDGIGASGPDAKRTARPDPQAAAKQAGERLKAKLDSITDVAGCDIASFATAHADDWKLMADPQRKFFADRMEKHRGTLSQAPKELADIPF